jgi:hypothetical protein
MQSGNLLSGERIISSFNHCSLLLCFPCTRREHRSYTPRPSTTKMCCINSSCFHKPPQCLHTHAEVARRVTPVAITASGVCLPTFLFFRRSQKRIYIDAIRFQKHRYGLAHVGRKVVRQSCAILFFPWCFPFVLSCPRAGHRVSVTSLKSHGVVTTL